MPRKKDEGPRTYFVYRYGGPGFPYRCYRVTAWQPVPDDAPWRGESYQDGFEEAKRLNAAYKAKHDVVPRYAIVAIKLGDTETPGCLLRIEEAKARVAQDPRFQIVWEGRHKEGVTEMTARRRKIEAEQTTLFGEEGEPK